jgi:hypothetical protein
MRKTTMFNRSTQRITAVLAVPLVTAGALALTASPAAAAVTTKCSAYQYQSAPVVTNVAMKTCVAKSGNSRYAYISIEQASAYSGSTWDLFKVNVRLERNDGNVDTASCDYTSEMNKYKQVSFHCATATISSSLSGGWTSDGTIDYNFNLDGLGTKNRALTGSPQMS